ncbi:oxidoreductase, aldo/keto reductase family protein [Ancylostoma ceylanicum]|uniref:Oxidoreductase, aldo/keto reductase family protein n=1 Tax=Ancylostoma ceylanicum TaxID=53326 RepID=A0A0D6LT21_9BILA|nr:oxidoreductase, aldo/keto reductase family protein [Ancylostoma ceylanicum]
MHENMDEANNTAEHRPYRCVGVIDPLAIGSDSLFDLPDHAMVTTVPTGRLYRLCGLFVQKFEGLVSFTCLCKSTELPGASHTCTLSFQQMPAPTVKLSSGFEMPLVGLGTWQSKPGEVGKAVEAALKAGYTHIDCAWIYGNQVEIGEVLKKLFSSTHKKNVEEILTQLQLKYIDLMLIHWPGGYEEGTDPLPKRPGSDKYKYSNEDYITTWKVLEGFVKEGKIRSIGISNFNHKQIDRVIANSTIKPAVHQVECHPYLQQKKLRAYCKEKGIAVTAYRQVLFLC